MKLNEFLHDPVLDRAELLCGLLIYHMGPISQAQLAARTNYSRRQIRRIYQRLAELQYVNKTVDSKSGECQYACGIPVELGGHGCPPPDMGVRPVDNRVDMGVRPVDNFTGPDMSDSGVDMGVRPPNVRTLERSEERSQKDLLNKLIQLGGERNSRFYRKLLRTVDIDIIEEALEATLLRHQQGTIREPSAYLTAQLRIRGAGI